MLSPERRPRIVMVALCAAFIGLLHVSYVNVDSVLFGYVGLTNHEPGLLWDLAGWLLALLPALWLPVRLRRPSEIAYLLLYFMVYVPTMWLPYRVLERSPYEIFTYTLVVAALFALLRLAHHMPRARIPRPLTDTPTLYFLVMSATLACIAVVVTRDSFSLTIGLANVYERRLEARESVPTATWAGYVIATLASSLAPVLIAHGLATRRYWLIPFGLLGSLSIFMLGGHKTQIAIPIFLVAMAWVLVRFRDRIGHVLAIGAGAMTLLSILAYTVFGSAIVPAITTYRLMFSRGMLTSYYFDFFSGHPPTLYSDGIGRFFVERRYDLATPRLIGSEYFGNEQLHANANIWASAFADGGWIAMVVVTLVVFVIFRAIDSMAATRGYLFPALMMAVIATTWADTSLDTSILSDGVLVTLLLIYFLPPTRDVARSRRRLRFRLRPEEP